MKNLVWINPRVRVTDPPLATKNKNKNTQKKGRGEESMSICVLNLEVFLLAFQLEHLGFINEGGSASTK